MKRTTEKEHTMDGDLNCLICGHGATKPWAEGPEYMVELAVRVQRPRGATRYAPARLLVHVGCLASEGNVALGDQIAVRIGLKAEES